MRHGWDVFNVVRKLAVSQRMQHTIVVRATTARAISTDIIRQTIFQHCCASVLELSPTRSVELRLPLYF